MRFVVLRRSLAAAAAITLLTIPTALAETVEADYDLVTAGSQNVVDLGTVAPGADVHVNLYFTLTCSGTSHVNANQAVKLTPSTRIIPLDGGWSMSTFIFGLGSAWPADGEPCPADIAPTVGGPMAMIVTAPSVPGTGYRYFFSWTPSVTPASTDDATVFALPKPSVTFTLNVAAGATNTAPTLNLPADSTVEGNRVGG